MALPLTKGDSGAGVAELQRLLVARGFPVTEDGDFGNATYRAVRAFQAQNLGAALSAAIRRARGGGR